MRGGFAGRMPGGGGQGGRSGGRGGVGGLLNTSAPGSDLTTLLRNGSSGYTWTAATVGSNPAASYQLAADVPVMAIGGFNAG